MSDLRERMAAVLAETHSFGKTTFLELAGALIAEFHLTEDSGVIVGCLHD